EIGGFIAFTGAAFDRPVDVIVGHALGPRGLDRTAKARIAVRISPAGFRRDGDFLRQFAEDLAAFGVNRAFETLDLRPFAMSRHELGILLILKPAGQTLFAKNRELESLEKTFIEEAK